MAQQENSHSENRIDCAAELLKGLVRFMSQLIEVSVQYSTKQVALCATALQMQCGDSLLLLHELREGHDVSILAIQDCEVVYPICDECNATTQAGYQWRSLDAHPLPSE